MEVMTISETIKVNIYCDEVKETTIEHSYCENEKWIYMGLLIVPVHIEGILIQTLLNKRCGHPSGNKTWNECANKCQYHEKNNKEVHYQNLNSKDKFFIAKRWLDFFMDDREFTYYYLLGINLMNLDYSYFGNASGSKRFSRIYNRFFRTAIQKSVKSCFSNYSRIIINNVVHDNSDLQFTELFPWHSIYRLEREDEKIYFNNNDIEFLDSDHNVSLDKRSNLIQYSDLLLGLFFNCLHLSTSNEDKNDLSLMVLPLVRRLMFDPGNVNSRYEYVNRLAIDFFPRYRFKDMDEFERDIYRLDSFYKKRELRVERLKQPTLFD